jgi:Uma2 family endonuclease
MSTALHTPSRPDQTAFNLRRWEQLLRDPDLASIEGRVETDQFGEIVVSPPPTRFHANYQSRLVLLLGRLLPDGEILTECPVSTDDGVRAADVAWLSPQRSKDTANEACLSIAPDICIEVLSPSNAPQKMAEKAALYFSAGAQEVWWCEEDGMMRFFAEPGREVVASGVCAKFPKTIAGQS